MNIAFTKQKNKVEATVSLKILCEKEEFIPYYDYYVTIRLSLIAQTMKMKMKPGIIKI